MSEATKSRHSLRDLKLIWGFWRHERARFLGLTLMTLAYSVVSVFFPRLIGYCIDAVQAGLQDPASFQSERLVHYALLLFGVSSASAVLGNLAPILAFNTGVLFNYRVRNQLFRKIVDKGFRFINRFPSGDVIERLDQDLGEVSWFTGWGTFWPIMSVFTLGLVVLMLLRMNWQLTLIAVLPISLMILVWRRFQARIEKAWRTLREKISETNGFLEASFSGIRLVKAYRMETNSCRRFRALLDDRIVWALRVARLEAFFHSMYVSISELAILLILLAGGLMVMRGSLTLGEFVAFHAYVAMLVWPMMGIGDVFVRVRKTAVEEARIREMAEYPPDVEIRPGGLQPRPGAELVLDAVNFSYGAGEAPGRPAESGTKASSSDKSLRLALQDVSLRIRLGTRIGIAGTVGSGKSTLMRLLLRLAEPCSGRVLLDGRALSDFDVPSLRALYGYAPQEAGLFSDTIRNNITLGRETGMPKPQLEQRLNQVLKIAQLESDLKAIPKGIDELIGERGLRLSGGQQGRVAIARALFDQPHILLLDDVTASLDAETEQQFIRDVLEQIRDATLVIVSHRLSILALCDVIYVFDQGRLAESGTHTDLLERRGIYWKLYQRQLSEEA
ncbi:MAG: ABC transporter ATP-binding protein [candidate division WOR-3 bacterium]